MSGSLFKHSSATARQAALQLGETGQARGEKAPPAAPPQPDERELEIRRLESEIAGLKDRLGALQREWDGRLAAARASAKDEAARAHVRDEARQIEALEHSLGEAREQFGRMLAAEVEPLAAALAARAVAQLVELMQDESDWLCRVIARRLANVAAGSVIAIHVAPAGPGEEIARLFDGTIPHDAEVRYDASLEPGTAKVVLKLGEIEIQPGSKAGELVRMLEQAGSADG
jgi:flagellar biosynthesis/type III secretory pathway protein FliH